MKTTIIFVRHAESEFIPGYERERGLVPSGVIEAEKVADQLEAISIDVIISSPYFRTIETLEPIAERIKKKIVNIEDLRERSIGNFNGISFLDAKRYVYSHIEYSFPEGESNMMAQERAIRSLLSILEEHKGKTIIIGTHGDIMTLMINYFDKNIDYDFWEQLSMPDIYELTFEDRKYIGCHRIWNNS